MRRDIRKQIEDLDNLALAVLLVLVLATLAAFAAFNSWVLMLALGAVHHEVSADVPALSYGASLLAYVGLTVAVSLFRGKRRR